MKTKFGLAVGLNVAVACLVMQGCKAPRVTNNNYGNDVKKVEAAPATQVSADDIQVSDTPPAAPTVAPSLLPVVVETAPAVEPVPSAKPKAKPAPAAESEYVIYKVKPGDMLSKISRRYNIRQKAILDLNPGLSPDKLYAGRTIKLPGKIDGAADASAAVPVDAAPASAAAASVKAPKAAKAAKYTGATKTYVVKSGDSLSKIAYENGTNVRTLKELNGLKNDRVFVGKKLKVPAGKADAKAAASEKKPDVKAASTEKKPVAKKDAASAKKDDARKADAKNVADAKKVEETSAAAALPAAPASEPVSAAAPAAEPSTPVASTSAAAPAAPVATLDTHTVKEGEDVVSIAISYGVSPSALMDANDLKSSEVKPGDVLKIPAKNAQ